MGPGVCFCLHFVCVGAQGHGFDEEGAKRIHKAVTVRELNLGLYVIRSFDTRSIIQVAVHTHQDYFYTSVTGLWGVSMLFF